MIVLARARGRETVEDGLVKVEAEIEVSLAVDPATGEVVEHLDATQRPTVSLAPLGSRT